jgi:amino acid adenylation domain-containing protein
VAWEATRLAGTEGRRLREYWLGQLDGTPPVLNLPTDQPRRADHEFRNGVRRFEVDAALTQQLRALAKAHQTTLYTVCVAVLQTLLYRYTGQPQLLIGSPMSGRTQSHFRRTMGYFVNPVALRADFNADPSFGAFLDQTSEVVQGALAHQDYPFPMLINDLQLQREAGRAPLFNVLLNYQRLARFARTPDAMQRSLMMESVSTLQDPGTYDITLDTFEDEHSIEIRLQYDANLFDDVRMARMQGHLLTLLASIVADPEQRVSELNYLTEAERHQLLDDWNGTQTLFQQDACIHHLFEEQAARTPANLALTVGDMTLPYAELNCRANQLARYMSRLGVGRGALVGVCLERSIDMVVAVLAVLKAGAAYVPVDPAFPQERIAFMLSDAQVALMLTQQTVLQRAGLEGLVSENTRAVYLDSTPEIGQLDGTDLGLETLPNDAAYVIYTSGSTGKPKGVVIRHSAVVNFLSAMQQQPGLSSSDVLVAVTTLSFDIAVLELLLPLVSGARVVIASSEEAGDARKLARLLDAVHATVMQATPTTWRMLVESRWQGKPDLKILCGGEALPPALAAELLQRCESLWNMYGPTETTVWSTVKRIEPDGAINIGRPIANTRIYILDAQRQLVPVGYPGELYIGGAGLAIGYLHRHDLTAEKFVTDPFNASKGDLMYATGDLACYLPNGEIDLLGRADSQVKLRGYRIELGEIEVQLARHPSVSQAVVRIYEETPGEKYLVGYVILREGYLLDSAELQHFLRQTLPEYMIPTLFMTLRAFPLTPNGKVDRRALPAPQRGALASQTTYVAPRTATEAELDRIWINVLGVQQVGVHDNFFELGGHSLLATQIVSRVSDVFRIELPLRQLFETPTVAGMAECIDATLQGAQVVPALAPAGLAQTDPAPLSFSQERMWFINQLNPDTAAYNVAAALRLSGSLNQEALVKTLDELVRRNESMRTTFRIHEGTPLQVVAPPAPALLTLIDLRNVAESQREAEATRLTNTEAQYRFNLEQGPLARFTLLRVQDDRHILIINTHHAVSDAWSMGVIARELVALYNAYAAGAQPQLPDSPLRYADFSTWQRQWFQGDVLDTQMAYWRKQLADVPILELPANHARPPVQTYRGSHQTILLPDTLLETLQTLSQQVGVTPFMSLLATFQVLLYRYTGQTDIAVGVPIANRRWLSTEDLVGTLVNTLVMRTNLGGDPSFRDLLQRVKTTALEAYAYQDLPFAKLVAELSPERDLSHSPLFQVMFNVVNVPVPSIDLHGLQTEYVDMDYQASQFDLTLTITDITDLHSAVLGYNTDLFDEETIVRMLGHFVTLLRGVVAAPDECISQLPLLSDAERRQLLVDWNRTEMDLQGYRSITQLIEAQVSRTPDRIAVSFGSESLSYRELNERANQLAHHLRRMDDTQDAGGPRLAGICMERSLDMVVGVLGILKAGMAYVPLDPAFPAERLAFMMDDAQLRILVTQPDLAQKLPPHRAQVVYLSAAQDEAETANPALPYTGDEPAYLLYTSGSTGKPKGVLIPHRAVVNFLLSMRQEPGLQSDDVLVAVTTLSFDIAGLELYLPLITGARVVVASSREASDAARLMDLMQRSGVTVLQATPATWRMLIEAKWAGQPNLKILCGGEALSRELADALLERCASLWNVYGPTETTIWSTVKRVERGGAINIGRPIANTSIYILDSHHNPVPIGIPGDLYIGGVGLAKEYLHRPELTASRFIADPFSTQPGARMYATGDVARYLPDGDIELLGRSDFQVKLRGYRIELGEIEAHLANHAAVQQAVAVVREDKPGDKRLVAYYVPRVSDGTPSADLRAYLKGLLPDYMVPSAIVSLESMPMTPNRKVNRAALPVPDMGAIGAEMSHLAPRDEVESKLVQIWQEVLGIPEVGVTDHFFELGGHSLLTVRLFARIEEVFGWNLPLATIFEEDTIEHLATLLRRGRSTMPWATLVPIQPRGSKPPLFFVHPLSGDVIGFAAWTKHLGNDQPFYGLRARGLDGIEAPYERIEEMAALYIREIRNVQPTGPYYLGGYCAGGPIAFEMAQQLHAVGERVAFVGIVNQAPPRSNYHQFNLRPRTILAFMRNLPYWLRDSAGLSAKELAYRAWEKILSQHLLNRDKRYVDAFNAAWDSYVPRPYPGKLTVFRTLRQPLFCSFDPTLCWDTLALGGVEVRSIPGSNTTILREPYSYAFTRQLSACLRE